MEFKKKLILRTVAGDNLLVPVGSAVSEFNGVFTISATAAVAFRAIENGDDEEAILLKILDEFDVDRETAKNDLDEFLSQLKEFGII